MPPQNEQQANGHRSNNTATVVSGSSHEDEDEPWTPQRVMRMSLEFQQQQQQQTSQSPSPSSRPTLTSLSDSNTSFYPTINDEAIETDVEESWRRSFRGNNNINSTQFAAAASASQNGTEQDEEKAEEGSSAYDRYMNRNYIDDNNANEEDSKLPSASSVQAQQPAMAEATPASVSYDYNNADGYVQPYASAATASSDHVYIPYEATATGEQDDDLIALKRAAYGGYYDDTQSTSVQAIASGPSSEHQAAEATVVDDYVMHPSEFNDPNSVQAQFVGQDFSSSFSHQHEASSAAPVAAAAASVPQHQQEAFSVMGEVGDDDHDDDNIATAAQATILQDGDNEHMYAEEAQVMQDSGASIDAMMEDEDLDTKPPAVEHNVDGSDDSGTPGEAQVLGITEEIHPSEFIDEPSPAQAELVGSDFNTAFAVQEPHPPSTSDSSEHHAEATIVSDRGQSMNNEMVSSAARATGGHDGVQATLVVDENTNNHNRNTSDSSAVVATFVDGETGQEVTAVTEIDNHNQEDQEATPVAAILETQDYEPSTVKTLPPHLDAPPRASSDHTPRPGHNPFEDDPNDTPAMSRDGLEALDIASGQPDWMSTPAFGGHADPNLFVEAIRPPSQQEEASDEPSIPAPQPVASIPSSTRSESSTGHSLHTLSSSIARGTGNVMEMLFGDTNPIANSRRGVVPVGFQDESSLGGSILPRSLLPSSVIFSESTKTWVATVNTNQKALDQNNVEESSKALRAFSVQSKKQALCLAKQWAPPRMHPFESNPTCFICEAKFAVFKRACHCRNCGVCICNSCSLQWPSKMLPLTYNIKKASTVNVCKACDWLCTAFRLALLDGDYDKAVALYSTGNVNLTSPFANVKGELFYPVHCAVLGNSLQLLKWLVDENCCPLRSLRVSGSYTSVLTSKGRSLLGIALENRNVGILRYLVVAKRMSLSQEKSLDPETLVQCLDLVLRVLPEEVLTIEQDYNTFQSYSDTPTGHGFGVPSAPLAPDESFSSLGPNALLATNKRLGSANDDAESTGSVQDACIICFSNTIDCVATPCGHQICCLECSNNISRCPVCATECSFMRVFKP